MLDCLDSTFALLEAYGAGEEATADTETDGGRGEGGPAEKGGAGGARKRKKKVGKRLSKFERLLMEEKEKDLLRMRRLQQQQPLDADNRCLPLPPTGDGSFDLYHSASSLSASTGSSVSGSSQSFTFHDRPSFHTLQVNDRQSQQPATAFLQSADEHQVVIPSPSPKLQSPSAAAVSPAPPAFSLVTHDPSSVHRHVPVTNIGGSRQ